jgi:rubrerythrin
MMPLKNFGAILNFAETVETSDLEFYRRAGAVVAAAERGLFDDLVQESKKQVALVQRTRRENVTEMILEPIQGFERGPYRVEVGNPDAADVQEVMQMAAALEERAIRYYDDAAAKIRALPEVSRAMKTLGKKRRRRLERLHAAGAR